MRFNQICILCAFLTVVALPSPAQPIISEFMAQNDTVLADEDGAFSDWIEIYNPGPSATNLNGFYLTDDASNLTKWRLPSQSVAAGGYVVVFASGKNRAVAGAQLHTSFSLDADGEYLALVASNGTTVISSFGAAFPKQFPDISYGVQTSGTNPTLRTNQAGYLVSHTPGTANTVIPGPHPLYCDTSLARIEITASQAVWDGLQASTPTSVESSVNVRFRHGDIDVTVTNVGISARGNTSLKNYPRSFTVSFNSFVPGQNLFGIDKLNLNSEANDPSTARSKLSFDLHQAAGLPTPYANHVSTVIIGPNNHRSGPSGYFFDAVLNNTQPVDDVFIKQRFEDTRGNLYKCTYNVNPANLMYLGATGSSYSSQPRYELKYLGNNDASYNDFASFINILNNTPNANFASVIRRNFEVDDFLKRLALDVLTSDWDGYWGNYNNFHLYRDPGSGRWHYIPYDQDNTFSIRWITPSSGDWATQNIYTWGQTANVPLVTRILDVPEFKNRYSYYMNQLLQGNYQNSKLNPLVYRIRQNQTSPLPFNDLSITNCKSAERSRYSGDWPNWTYTQYSNSFDFAQVGANPNVPNYHGVTEFITARRTNALNQLTLSNIGPIISPITITPKLPATNQLITVSARVEDDVSVSTVRFISRFSGVNTTNNMFDNGIAPDSLAGDKIFTAQIGPFPSAGILTYYVQATDNVNKPTFEPWGGAADTNSLTIGSAFLGLAITELNYHPHEPTGSELLVSTNADDYEFIEFQNFGGTTINLAGAKFIAGISYTFPATNLAPAARVVLAKNLTAFNARYGTITNRLGTVFAGQLSNGGEELHLTDTNGATILRFTYQDTTDWPGRADGNGSSLELINHASDYSDGANWRDSISYGGSPGTAGLAQAPGIVINEILTHTDLPLVDAIELHNPTASAINIGGWYLSDSDTPYKKYRIPTGTTLAAGGYITFDETNHFNMSGGVNTNDFRLDAAHGDDVWLLQANAQSNLVAFVDHLDFGAARNGESFGRWPNGSGKLYPMLTRTFSATNSGPRIGPVIISEFMYQPSSGNPMLEFVEILNTGSLTENLTNWKLTGNADYSFPTNTLLPPGGALAVLPFNPSLATNATTLNTFRTYYGIGTNTVLLGAFLGSLSDTGDTLRLQRPDEPPLGEPTFIPMLLEDEVSYSSALPWPTLAAGGGPSLLRRAPDAWGNDPLSWMAGTVPFASPGVSPLADKDGDGLPDAYEIETYGSTNIVGTSLNSDTDGDGASDAAEYIAGTSATNANSKFKITANRLPNGTVTVSFQTEAISGSGYFGLERRYDLMQTTNIASPASWSVIPGYANLPGIGSIVTYTNSITNSAWSARGRVWLQ